MLRPHCIIYTSSIYFFDGSIYLLNLLSPHVSPKPYMFAYGVGSFSMGGSRVALAHEGGVLKSIVYNFKF